MDKYWIYCGPYGRYEYQETREFKTEQDASNYALEKAIDNYKGLSREEIWKDAADELGPFDGEVDEEYVDELYLEVVQNSMSYKAVKVIPGANPRNFEGSVQNEV